jgi:hypothetical protein
MSPIEAERGVRPRGVMDFDPSRLHEVDGRTVINPAMTAGKHREALHRSAVVFGRSSVLAAKSDSTWCSPHLS